MANQEVVFESSFLIKRGFAKDWEKLNPVLKQGEIGFILDQNAIKIGDGVTLWNALPIVGDDEFGKFESKIREELEKGWKKPVRFTKSVAIGSAEASGAGSFAMGEYKPFSVKNGWDYNYVEKSDIRRLTEEEAERLYEYTGIYYEYVSLNDNIDDDYLQQAIYFVDTNQIVHITESVYKDWHLGEDEEDASSGYDFFNIKEGETIDTNYSGPVAYFNVGSGHYESDIRSLTEDEQNAIFEKTGIIYLYIDQSGSMPEEQYITISRPIEKTIHVTESKFVEIEDELNESDLVYGDVFNIAEGENIETPLNAYGYEYIKDDYNNYNEYKLQRLTNTAKELVYNETGKYYEYIDLNDSIDDDKAPTIELYDIERYGHVVTQSEYIESGPDGGPTGVVFNIKDDIGFKAPYKGIMLYNYCPVEMGIDLENYEPTAVASGELAFAQGDQVVAEGNYSHAEGVYAKASGFVSHAEGNGVTASGDNSHAEGRATTASGNVSHAEGDHTKASGSYSHAEGRLTTASGQQSHAEGYSTQATNESTHAEGYSTTASGKYSHAEGYSTIASGQQSHAEGYGTYTTASSAHAEGYYTTASGSYSHTEGDHTQATNSAAHAEGYYSKAAGLYAHAEGQSTTASGEASHSEGYNTKASGLDSHAEGGSTTASGSYSHAEGAETEASGSYSHAEGYDTTASGQSSHVEGWVTKATNQFTHAEGYWTTASGSCSHAEGGNTTASGVRSHAEGDNTIASGMYSHTEGEGTIAAGRTQHVQGKYNIEDTANQHAFIIGNGASSSERSNAFTVDWNGDTKMAGWLDTQGLRGNTLTRNLYVGGAKNIDGYWHPRDPFIVDYAEKYSVKNQAYVSTMKVPKEGTYWLTAPKGSNYIYKIQIQYANSSTNTFDINSLPTSTSGQYGDYYEYNYNGFTAIFGNKTRVDSSSKSFPDGSVCYKRFNMQNGLNYQNDNLEQPYPAIKFYVDRAAAVKVWWVAGDANRPLTIQTDENGGSSRLEVSGNFVAHGNAEIKNTLTVDHIVSYDAAEIYGGIVTYDDIRADGTVTIGNDLHVGGFISCGESLDMNGNDIKNAQTIAVKGTSTLLGDVKVKNNANRDYTVKLRDVLDEALDYGFKSRVYVNEMDGATFTERLQNAINTVDDGGVVCIPYVEGLQYELDTRIDIPAKSVKLLGVGKERPIINFTSEYVHFAVDGYCTGFALERLAMNCHSSYPNAVIEHYSDGDNTLDYSIVDCQFNNTNVFMHSSCDINGDVKIIRSEINGVNDFPNIMTRSLNNLTIIDSYLDGGNSSDSDAYGANIATGARNIRFENCHIVGYDYVLYPQSNVDSLIAHNCTVDIYGSPYMISSSSAEKIKSITFVGGNLGLQVKPNEDANFGKVVTQAELETVLGSYITDVAALVGGDA